MWDKRIFSIYILPTDTETEVGVRCRRSSRAREIFIRPEKMSLRKRGWHRLGPGVIHRRGSYTRNELMSRLFRPPAD